MSDVSIERESRSQHRVLRRQSVRGAGGAESQSVRQTLVSESVSAHGTDIINKHIFPQLRLESFINDQALSGVYRLEIFEVPNKSATTTRSYIYAGDEYGEPLPVLEKLPEKQFNIERSELRDAPELPTFNLRFTGAFPAILVFAAYFARRDKSGYEDAEFDALYYYARLIDERGESFVEGIIKPPFKVSLTTSEIAFVRNGIAKSAVQTDAFAVNLIHAAGELQKTDVIDSVTDKIDYTDATSSGTGFIDFLYRRFARNTLVSIADILQSFAAYVNTESELAKAGFFDSTVDVRKSSLFYGIRQLGYAVRKTEAGIERSTLHDAVEEKIMLDNFILSDSYGDPTTEQSEGELRDWTVERTRGLQDDNGDYAAKEPEYSFLKEPSAMALLSKIAASVLMTPSFEVAKSGTGFYMRINFRRRYHDGVGYEWNGSVFAPAVSSVVRVDKDDVDAKSGLVSGGTRSASERLPIQFEFQQPTKIEASEIFGSGMERVEIDGKRVRYDEIYEKNVWSSRKTSAVRGVVAPPKDETIELPFASARLDFFGSAMPAVAFLSGEPVTRIFRLPASLSDAQKLFRWRKGVGNLRLTGIVLYGAGAVSGDKLFVNMFAPAYYFAAVGQRIFYERYFAKAVLEFRKYEAGLLARITHGEVSFVGVGGSLSEETVFETNLLNEQSDFAMRRYVPLTLSVDAARGFMKGVFEQIKEPFDFPVSQIPNSTFDFFAKYDGYRVRQGIAVRRAGKTYGVTGTQNVYGDGWLGFKLGWNVSSEYQDVRLSCYRNEKDGRVPVFSIAVTNDNRNFAAPTREQMEAVYFNEGAYDFELEAVETRDSSRRFRKTIRADVTSGFLNQTCASFIKFDVAELTASTLRLTVKFQWQIAESKYGEIPPLGLLAFKYFNLALYPDAVRLLADTRDPIVQDAYGRYRETIAPIPPGVNNGLNRVVEMVIVMNQVYVVEEGEPAQPNPIRALESISIDGISLDTDDWFTVVGSGEPYAIAGEYLSQYEFGFACATSIPVQPPNPNLREQYGAVRSRAHFDKFRLEADNLTVLDLDFDNQYAANADEPPTAITTTFMKWKSKPNGEPDDTVSGYAALTQTDITEEIAIIDKSNFGRF